MDKNALEQAIITANRWIEASEIVLLIGIFGEYCGIYVLEKTVRRKTMTTVAKIAFAMLVMAGIWGEFRFGKEQSSYLELLQQANDTELERAREATAEARKSGADFLSRATQAERLASDSVREAMQAKAYGEVEHQARLKFQAANSDRRLTSKAQVQCAQNLQLYGDRTISIGYVAADLEASTFSADLNIMLVRSHWYVRDRVELPLVISLTGAPLEVNQRRGVWIQSTGDKASQTAAQALAKQIMAEGFDARYVVFPNADLGTRPIIHLTVQHRPTGPQGFAGCQWVGKSQKAAKLKM